MPSLIIGFTAIGIYLVSSALLFSDTLHNRSRKGVLIFAGIATLLHCALISQKTLHDQAFNFSFFNIASLVACLVSILLLCAALNKPVDKLGIAIFPIAAAMLGLDLFFPESTNLIAQHFSGPMYIHILTSIIAFSLLNIAALQAILLLIQEQQLRNHAPKRLFLRLPPLQTMEILLFQMIGTGVVFLSISLGSGFIFIENLFAQHLAHKTLLSILAWIIFSGLVYGRIRYGWRGKTAIKWTLIGFGLLLLAYFGSKLVLELILHKT